MDNLLCQLVNILKKELSEGEKLLAVSKLQKSSLKEFKLEHFKKSTDSSAKIISNLLDLEEQRIQILLDISLKLGVPCEELTISKILSSAWCQTDPYIRELKEIKPLLCSIFQELMRISQINKYLISRSLSFVTDRLKVLNRAISSTDTYGKVGASLKSTPTRASIFLNKEV